VHDTECRYIITQGQMLMSRTPASAAAKLNLMLIAFAFAAAPVAFGSAAVCALAGHRLISYWWLALTLGWAVVPSAVLTRANRYQRQVRAARLRDGRAAEPAPR
jgi:hypothetical protein